EKNPKIPLKGASVRTFAQNRAYRIRLERRGRTISFYARPLESWGQEVELTKDDLWVSLTMRKDQIDKAGRVPAADFRFLSLIRFTLDDLELSGTTLQREAN
ncbi:MAG: hypothetical protein O7C98_14995, partial [Planctomycetota bacterium]|nr:hypothetical protein [Planctomycetota bacterium]